MAQCERCRKKGFFVFVNEKGLCKYCAAQSQCRLCEKWTTLLITSHGLCYDCRNIFEMDVTQRLRIMNDCEKLVDNSKNMNTRLSRCDLLLEHAQALLKYEKKKIPTIKPYPSQYLKEYTAKRSQIILEGITEVVEKALAKAQIATTLSTSITHANKALYEIQEKRQQLSDQSKLNELEYQVRTFIHATQLNVYLEAARKAEFKGQKKKALDQYQEALYFLRNDEINDSLQEKEIKEIEKKVSDLSKIINSKYEKSHNHGINTVTKKPHG
jgi:hypothetical protein